MLSIFLMPFARIRFRTVDHSGDELDEQVNEQVIKREKYHVCGVVLKGRGLSK